jgi:hypothetical protein
LSVRGDVDIYFDRSVGPTSPAAVATIQAATAGTPQPLTLVTWTAAFGTNVLRFQLNPAMDTASAYTISFSNVIDGSNNSSSSTIPLTLVLQAPQPYTYAVLTQAQVTDAWVESISNAPGGYNRAVIDVFFNCTMLHSDIVNIANWTVTSNGSPVAVLSVSDWSSATDSLTFPAIDGHIYFAQVFVTATTATAPYVVQVTAHSEDSSSVTNPGNYTGSINVAPLATPARVVGAQVTPTQAIVRLNQDVDLPSSVVVTVSSSTAIPGQSGTAAYVSSTSGNTATITGLAGMTYNSVLHTLTLSMANTPGNNGTFPIVQYLPSSSVVIANAAAFAPDGHNGSIQWMENLVRPNGSVSTSSVAVAPSLQTLVLAITDLMLSFNQHVTAPYGAGHLVPDVTNHFLVTDLPGPTLASVITAVNKVQQVYFNHASSIIYHNYPDPDLVTGPLAVDFPSAVILAEALITSFVAHNINVGVHVTAGVPLFSSKLFDTVSFNLNMLEGASYALTVQSQYSYIDVGEHSVPTRFTASSSFVGVAIPPYVASAIPKQGIVMTNNGVRFEQDAIIIFFSKVIQPAAAPNFVISPLGIQTMGFEWVNTRVLSLGVVDMQTAQYMLDVYGVQDPYGNAIESAP